MKLQDIITESSDIEHALFTGILRYEKCTELLKIIQPQSFDAVGTLVDMTKHMGQIDYKFSAFGEWEAAKHFNDVGLVCVLNNNVIKPAHELIDAWLPVIEPGGYLICFDHYADLNSDLQQADENTTDYPPNWYRQA